MTFLCNNELSFYELYSVSWEHKFFFCSDCNCNVTTHESAIKLPNAIVRMSQHASSPPKKPRAHPVPVGQKGSKRLSPTKDVKSLWPCLSMTRHEFSAWKRKQILLKKFVKLMGVLHFFWCFKSCQKNLSIFFIIFFVKKSSNWRKLS